MNLGQLRPFLNEVLARTDWQVISKREPPGGGIARVIEALIPSDETCKFLQVGANDGEFEDDIARLRRNLNWQGYLLEPNPAVFQSLLKNVSIAGNPQVKALQVAIGPVDGTVPFYRVCRDLPEDILARGCLRVPSTSLISSLEREQVVGMCVKCGINRSDAETMIEEVPVQSYSFESFLKHYEIARLDVVLIDVEGLDAQLLAAFPLNAYLPKVVVCEHEHMTQVQLSDTLRLFEEAGYCWLVFGRDLLFIRVDALRPGAMLIRQGQN
jgi:FkbM family methyltransferase